MVKIILLIVLSGCFVENENEVARIILEPERLIESIDGHFFAWVKDLRRTDKGFSFVDRRGQYVVLVDEVLTTVNTYGNKGKGPSEFLGLISACLNHDVLIAVDSETDNIVTINLQNDSIFSYRVLDLNVLHTRVAYIPDSELMYLQTLPFQSAIERIDLKSGIGNSFGEPFNSDDFGEVFARSHRHLVNASGDLIYAIWYSEPVIEVFDDQGNLLNTYDFCELEYFEERLAYVQNKIEGNSNVKSNTYTLFEDAYYFENGLYVLYAGTDDDDKYTCNEVMVFSATSDILQPKQILTLGGSKAYSTICVWEGKIMAYDSVNGSFHLYKT